ncbi:MAG: heterodisulfide reductase-related iron-sulfur binding cluster [Acidobacteriota bacterium]|nr:heterodisulfide reductase-related iron-sulfur binding cluster [Acidobacteriota bacterium]
MVRDEAGYETIRNSVTHPLKGLKVAIHYGCHLLKPSRIMNVDNPDDPSVLENLIRALGAEPVRHRNWYLCCGKACQNEDIPNNMMHDLLGAVHDEKADILGMICPTCFGQFDHGQMKIAKLFDEDYHTPAVYYFQLLALAQGVPYTSSDSRSSVSNRPCCSSSTRPRPHRHRRHERASLNHRGTETQRGTEASHRRKHEGTKTRSGHQDITFLTQRNRKTQG